MGLESGQAQTGAAAQANDDPRLALICLAATQQPAPIQAALQELGYTVHIPANPDEALEQIAQNRYELVLIHEAYGGSAEQNQVLKTIQTMAMPLRRHMCIGLIGGQFKTSDHMMAFARSVHFVMAESDLGTIKTIARRAVTENDHFYKTFRECLREVGKE
jgi:DNA-binding NtrC family response regulator